MKDNKLEIIVRGRQMSGKSTVAQLLKETLLKEKFLVSVEELDSNTREWVSHQNERLDALKNKNTWVHICVEQVPK